MTTFTITSSIICLIIVFLIMLNMYYPLIGDEDERIKIPLYIYILVVIICIIPILNILATIVYIAFCIWNDDLIIKGPIGKIIKFLSKPV